MSKPIKEITIITLAEKSTQVKAVFDSGSFYTIIREDKLPADTIIEYRKEPIEFRTAGESGKLKVIGGVLLTITIDEKMIADSALVSPNLAQEMLIGAKTMQGWDISIQNLNGKTEIIVGHDMRDPDIIEVD